MGLLSSIGQKFGLARNYILPNYFDIGWKMRTYTSEDSLLVSSKGVPTLLLFSYTQVPPRFSLFFLKIYLCMSKNTTFFA